MDRDTLSRRFERIGARAVVGDGPLTGRVTLDVRRDRRGEFFDLRAGPAVELEVIDARPDQRHLLVLARNAATGDKDKFLCGHDERAWFVAAVPGDRGVSNVRTPMEALKPQAVRDEQARRAVRFESRSRRRTAAYLRQGEWFFIPAPDLAVPGHLVNRPELLVRRGAGLRPGKPHVADFGFRYGGELVYVSDYAPSGLTEEQYNDAVISDPEARQFRWRTMRRNAALYVKGRIRHPDHKTLTLGSWYRVEMNTEHRSRARANVVFLD